MALQQINVGASANDNTGDPLRTAFQKVNANTTETATLANPIFTTDITVNSLKVGKGGGNVASNLAIGVNTLANNTASGLNNLAIGTSVLDQNVIGGENLAIGNFASANNTDGNNNIAIGINNSKLNNSGNQNTSVGWSANYGASGSGNTSFGFSANYAVGSGVGNTSIGHQAGYASLSYNNTSCLGKSSAITASNQVQLGDSATTTYVYGTVNNRSDLRDKTDVQDTVLGLDFISKLRPVDYRWDMREDYKTELPIQGELSDADFKIEVDLWLENNKLSNLNNDGSKKRNRFHHGFIAQEVRDLGIDFGGFQDHSLKGGEDVLSIGYDEFIAPMIKAIQELKAEIELLKMK